MIKNIFTQPAYSLELAERMTAKIPSIKLRCGVCNTKPKDTKDVLYINEYGICIDCANYDANYERKEGEYKCD